ncbi:Rossmann-like alpha/beta/alpha sandwich fold [Sesbania bispinosa]|nr:Rossmann-like alpha/beta/alpha sandwich fold [Sesbania bispinosa]
MCGIALIVSGIRIDISSLLFDSTCLPRQTEKSLFSLDDLKAALRRRGPDSLGAKKLFLQFNVSGKNQISSFIDDMLCSGNKDDNGECDNFGIHRPASEFHFIGATLQLRGTVPLVQPLVDASGNVLVYNGEIFGGFNLASDCNDAEFLMQTLGKCCSCGSCLTGNCVKCGESSVPDILSTIKGPWAIIYWQDCSRTLWFGRDAFGRRSLLVHWPTEDDPTFLLSSVSPVPQVQQASVVIMNLVDVLYVNIFYSICHDQVKLYCKCRWRLVEIDAALSDLMFESSHVMSLINPANTYMDLNIGIALWLASGGDGWVSDANADDNDDNHARIKYKSNAKILLVGSGADEQCAGYGRHRTSYRRGSWLGLHEEMKLDMQRIWKRNLGRDDRCIADNGKEARFPFLDEDVIKVLLNIPLWEVANLDQPSGIGDKKILRELV